MANKESAINQGSHRKNCLLIADKIFILETKRGEAFLALLLFHSFEL